MNNISYINLIEWKNFNELYIILCGFICNSQFRIIKVSWSVVKIDGEPIEEEEFEPGPVINVNGDDTIDGIGPVEDIDGIPLEDLY